MLKPVTLVIPAGGAGLRLDPNQPKQFLEHRGLKTIEWTLKAFEPIRDRLKKVVIVLPKQFLNDTDLKHNLNSLDYTEGGDTRQESVYNGLKYLEEQKLLNDSLCLVHDAARPLLHKSDLQKLIDCLDRESNAALLAIPVKDTLKKANNLGEVSKTVSREHLWQAQTPQAAEGALMLDAHRQAHKKGWVVTDDASILEQAGLQVKLIESQHLNFKITTAQDWDLFKRLI